MLQTELLKTIITEIENRSSNKDIFIRNNTNRGPRTRGFIIGISGQSGSGKTVLAEEIYKTLKISKEVILISADWFHFTREQRYNSPGELFEQHLYHAIDFQRLINQIIEPVINHHTEISFNKFDVENDCGKDIVLKVNYPLIVIIEGIYLFQELLVKYFDFKIFLEITNETSISRCIKRKNCNEEEAKKLIEFENKKYIPAWQLHLSQHNPKSYADFIVNNIDFVSPLIEYQDN